MRSRRCSTESAKGKARLFCLANVRAAAYHILGSDQNGTLEVTSVFTPSHRSILAAIGKEKVTLAVLLNRLEKKAPDTLSFSSTLKVLKEMRANGEIGGTNTLSVVWSPETVPVVPVPAPKREENAPTRHPPGLAALHELVAEGKILPYGKRKAAR